MERMKGRAFCTLAALAAGMIGWIGFGDSLVLGQSFSATVLGVVHDATGGVIPGVTVTAKHTESGLTRTVDTSESGDYRMPALPVGEYELTAEKSGFKQQLRR